MRTWLPALSFIMSLLGSQDAFAIGVANQTNDYTDEVVLDSPGRMLPANYFGMGVSNAENCSTVPHFGLWTDPLTSSVLNIFAPTVVRYLGGMEANYWDWTIDWVQKGFGYAVNFHPAFSSPGANPDLNDTPQNFMNLIDNSDFVQSSDFVNGRATLFDLNVMTWQCPQCRSGAIMSPADLQIYPNLLGTMINNQIAFLKTAQKNNLPVKYIELGNEFYWGGYLNSHRPVSDLIDDDYQTAFPNGTVYAQTMNSWTAALHKAFPGAKTAIVAAPDWGKKLENWNEEVFAANTNADAVTFHPYPVVPDDELGTSSEAVLAAAFKSWELNFGPVIHEAYSKGLPTWVTEFNMADQSKGVIETKGNTRFVGNLYAPTWVAGLFTAHMLMDFAVDPAVQMVNYFNMISAVTEDNATNSSGLQTTTLGGLGGTTVYFNKGKPYLSASGNALAIFGNALNGASQVIPLKLSGSISPMYISQPSNAAETYEYPAVEGMFIEQGATSHFIMVNYSPNTLYLDFSQYPKVQAEMQNMESVSAPGLSTLVYGNPLTPTCMGGSVVVNNKVKLPPYSINDLSNARPVGCQTND